MFGSSHHVLAQRCFFVIVILGIQVSPALLKANEPTVKFDVPALVCVSELPESFASNEKVIEVIVPVSTQIQAKDRDNVEEFRFDVFWNRNAYPLVNYGPKSQTASDIEGLVSIEKSTERNKGIGLSVGATYELINGSLKADFSGRDGTKTKYQEVPEHDVLVASGSTRRGTGAFFRFHPSRREVLEGGRELVLAFRVPSSWRGGILKIECRASGNRKVLGAWKEPFEEGRAFVVPVHLESDEAARQAAVEFVQSEQQLRSGWSTYQNHTSSQSSRFLTFSKPTPNRSLPEQWAHLLIQSGNDDYFERYRRTIPSSLDSAAGRFVNARQKVLQLSR